MLMEEELSLLPPTGQMWTPEERELCTIGRALTRLTWTGHRERSDVLSLHRPIGSDLDACSLQLGTMLDTSGGTLIG
jgi:gamma-glutamylcysteine synthetase